ncbi:MAG: ABC-F family ATP-binding cassette domain-containing protein [Chlamydiota bacterium]
MTLFIHCQELTKSFGTRRLFSDLSMSVFSGDRIGLIGPNGTGKSTLLKILAGIERADSGEVSMKRDLKVGYVPQTCDFPSLLPEEILHQVLEKDASLQSYEKETLVQTWLSKLGFRNNTTTANLLSGGWKKRLALAKELITFPDLLLLDEPTNHLDLEGILFLEKFLAKEAATYLLVSHDRYFLQNATNKIIEIDFSYPKGIFAIDGTYGHFLEKKEEFLKGQLERQRSLASKARKETEWLRASPKARTSKSKARIEDAHELLEELSQVKHRNKERKADIDFTASERETRKLLVAKNLSKHANERPLFRQLDFTLSPGTRIGLMGPNGSGKTTLLRILANEIEPDVGTIKRADGLKTVYFDQHRTQLPDTITLRTALSPNGDFVVYQGQSIHVNGWCKRFLFSPDILDMPLGKLSGGERARIAIAHLMLEPADLLLLDEPTNDLDIPTLEILEESLLEFPGAVVLITHDRCMLDRICNLFFALGNPECTDLYADYVQWEMATKNASLPTKTKEKSTKANTSNKPKLSYIEKKEYEEIEKKIGKLEEEIRILNHKLSMPDVTENPGQLQEACTAIALKEAQIEQLYLRFLELDQKT